MKKSFETLGLALSLTACGSTPTMVHKDLGNVSQETSTAVQNAEAMTEVTTTDPLAEAKEALMKLGKLAQDGNPKASKVIATAVEKYCEAQEKETALKTVERCLQSPNPPLACKALTPESITDEDLDESLKECEHETSKKLFNY